MLQAVTVFPVDFRMYSVGGRIAATGGQCLQFLEADQTGCREWVLMPTIVVDNARRACGVLATLGDNRAVLLLAQVAPPPALPVPRFESGSIVVSVGISKSPSSTLVSCRFLNNAEAIWIIKP